ncbi:hypothetical protein GGR43_003006 [Sphingobium jiangsuense]|uniref:Uncharacterized protein n=1 Tax=Sphingobium jiangsuense TaxID=870476 RepID=A0A7W6BPA6_9SPHN|nr:hypothetical protein [Sphingobium jiangsuense]
MVRAFSVRPAREGRPRACAAARHSRLFTTSMNFITDIGFDT